MAEQAFVKEVKTKKTVNIKKKTETKTKTTTEPTVSNLIALNPINKHHLFIWRNETNSYKRAKWNIFGAIRFL